MFRAFLSSWPIFVGMGLLMLGNGLLVTLLTVRGAELGFSDTTIGIMQSCYPLGAIVGCIVAPKLVARVGHARAFGALASLCSVSALVHLTTTDPWSWSAMRGLAGFCFPGLYVVSESWLNAKATNATRGTLLSVYFVVQTGGAAAGQMLLAIPDPQGTRLFVIVSILISIALVPMLLSRTEAPAFVEPERFGLKRLWAISPLGTIGALLNGISAGMIYVGLGIYAQALGLGIAVTGGMVAMAGVGGMIGQIPLAQISDRVDRRNVIAAAALLGAMVCVAAAGFETAPLWMIALASALILPIYSLCVAHTNDYLNPAQIVPASGALVLTLNAGVIAGPLLAALVIGGIGPAGLFWMLALLQISLFAFTVLRRISRREKVADQGNAAAISYSATAVSAELNPQATTEREAKD